MYTCLYATPSRGTNPTDEQCSARAVPVSGVCGSASDVQVMVLVLYNRQCIHMTAIVIRQCYEGCCPIAPQTDDF